MSSGSKSLRDLVLHVDLQSFPHTGREYHVSYQCCKPAKHAPRTLLNRVICGPPGGRPLRCYQFASIAGYNSIDECFVCGFGVGIEDLVGAATAPRIKCTQMSETGISTRSDQVTSPAIFAPRPECRLQYLAGAGIRGLHVFWDLEPLV